ncbi:hypothetical protein LB577_14750 [Mesorhizobium sp. B283B1A]|uniref:hypothetical protein n=1 Tax=Mesorhizobium TaxID=68287 RepID=UPI001CD07A53|nr:MULTISPECIES: hypothetical protein [Mesorhizobium]MCA0048203.1 hypothetical protein [Mesorhizobium sp. B283B1A]UQS67442.1 hypothetical protein M5D98_14420 [Mesorhizobium opportunistum]
MRGGDVEIRPTGHKLAEYDQKGRLRRVIAWADLDVTIGGILYAVECKRMETSGYGEEERMRMRVLWRPASELLEKMGLSVFVDVTFQIPIAEVHERYLLERAEQWLSSKLPSLLWQDDFARGTIGEMDLATSKESSSSTVLRRVTCTRAIRRSCYAGSALRDVVCRNRTRKFCFPSFFVPTAEPPRALSYALLPTTLTAPIRMIVGNP